MAFSINALKTGIYTKLNVANITNLVSGIFDDHAPQGTIFPFVTYFFVSGGNEDTFKNWGDETLLQIDIYSDHPSSAEECGDITEKITEEMDEAIITATGYSVYFCQRQGPPRIIFETENDVFHGILEYRIKLGKAK